MWRDQKQSPIENTFRVRWKKPQHQAADSVWRMQRRKSGTRTALLVSLILHLAVLLTLKDVILHRRGYEISDTVYVHMLDRADSVTEPQRPLRRAVEPIRIPREYPAEPSPGRFSQNRLPEQSIKTSLTDKKAPETRIPTVSASISKDRPLPNPISAGTSAIGASSQGHGKSDRSGSGRGGRGVGGLTSVSAGKVPTDGGSIGTDLQIYADADIPFIQALEEIARHVVKVRKSHKVDIVFIIDTSESMANDIDAVRRHLNRMIDRFQLAGVDFTLGVVRFHHSLIYEWLGMDITISPQTSNVDEVRETLRSIKVSGGERALDALMKSISKVEFRPGADRHFLLITDEYVKGTYPVPEVLKAAKRAKITIDVLGRDEVFQRTIAEQTGGIWTPIKKVRGTR